MKPPEKSHHMLMRKMNMKRQINLSIFVRSVFMQGFPEAAVENTQALAFFRKKTCPRLDEFTQCLWHLFMLFSFSFLPLKLSTSIHVQGVVFLDLASLKWIPLSSSCNFPIHTQPLLFYVLRFHNTSGTRCTSLLFLFYLRSLGHIAPSLASSPVTAKAI